MTMDIRGMVPLLQVYDMPAALHFYCEVLDFKMTGSAAAPGGSFDWVLLEWNKVHLMLNTQYEHNQRPAQPDTARNAHHKDMALFFSTPDIDGFYQHLLAHGLRIDAPINRDYGMRQLYLHDPDGYEICFQWPTE